MASAVQQIDVAAASSSMETSAAATTTAASSSSSSLGEAPSGAGGDSSSSSSSSSSSGGILAGNPYFGTSSTRKRGRPDGTAAASAAASAGGDESDLSGAALEAAIAAETATYTQQARVLAAKRQQYAAEAEARKQKENSLQHVLTRAETVLPPRPGQWNPAQQQPTTLESARDPDLFKVSLLKDGETWSTDKGRPLVRELPSFSVDGNNTLVVHCMMTDTTRFAVNITPNGQVNENVYFHFNPRAEKNTFVAYLDSRVNESWMTKSIRLKFEADTFPFPKGEYVFLRIAVYRQGFAVYVDGKFLCQFPHRKPLADGSPLFVQLSAAGDYQEVCSLECDGMWWGHSQHTHRETSAKGAAGAGVLVPDTVFVTNLASMVTKTMLLTTFSAVGDVEDVTAHPGKAWVRFVEPAGATAAVNELNGKLLGGQNMVVDMARSKKRQVKPGRGAGGGSGAAAGGRSLLGAPQQTLDSTLILL